MAGQFQGKVAIVTGGSSGIGQAAAIAFAREGARVVISADRDVAGGEATVKTIKKAGGEASFVKADVASSADVAALVEKTVGLYGRLDYAFNNAGIGGSWENVVDCPEDVWDRTIAVNLKGVWLCMKYEIPVMKKGGAIVNAASVAGVKALPNNADYVASKHGVVGLTKSAALAYVKAGIRVNVVCPGPTDTPLTRRTLLAPGSPGADADVAKTLPFGRMGTSEEVAAAAIWLCSDAAAYITGLVVTVDGGLSVM
jgi:NAD(P)-dependent dehydrogenase (short-subunit alcohol dehydrogenase family)